MSDMEIRRLLEYLKANFVMEMKPYIFTVVGSQSVLCMQGLNNRGRLCTKGVPSFEFYHEIFEWNFLDNFNAVWNIGTQL